MSLLLVLPNSLPGGSCITASSSQNSLTDGSFVEVNADMISTSTEPTCESLLLVLLKIHCQATAHLFVYVGKTFLVHL